MKKIVALFVEVIVIIVLAYVVGYGTGKNTYEIGLVTEEGHLMDGGFRWTSYEAVKAYSEANNKTYNYYRPGHPSDTTGSNIAAAMRKAVENGAKIIVAPGYLQAKGIQTAAVENPDVKFIFVDGWVLTDKENNPIPNVTAIVHKEEQAGFLAGYAAVKDGYTKLGGTFGGGGDDAPCRRFAYGYVQGAMEAAREMDVRVQVRISFKYTSSYTSSPELTDQMQRWYKNGTQVIFSCGGNIVQSVVAAAEKTDNGKIIGVDNDQSSFSDRVITSAIKDIKSSVIRILGEYYAGKWDAELAGKAPNLGIAEECIRLSMETSRFKKFTKADHDAICEKLKNGTIVPKSDVSGRCNAAFWKNIAKGSNVRVIYE